MTIAIVLGTRAELIKMSPIIKELEKNKIKYVYIHTGQHNISDLLNELNLKNPDIILENPKIKRGRFSSIVSAVLWNIKKFFLIRKHLKKIKPNLVLVHGDTMTTATATLSAKSLGYLVGHVEAGIRSNNIKEPWPEELSRRITDKFADYLFAPTLMSYRYLKRKYPNKKIFYTGNTNIDVLQENIKKIKKKKSEDYVFVKLHRQENIKSKKRLREFIKLLNDIPFTKKLILTYNTKNQLKKYNLLDELNKVKNLEILDELSYLKFLSIFSNANVILTDGGGETEEASYLRIPCANFRDFSERKEATLLGFNIYTRDIKKLKDYVINNFNKKIQNIPCPFGDGKAAEKIVKMIKNELFNNSSNV